MEHMNGEFCFTCNTKTKKYYSNLCELKTQRSGMPLCNLIAKFLNEVRSERQVNDKSNVICVNCFARVQSYDQAVLVVKDAEKKLRDILSKTENELLNKPNVSNESKIIEINDEKLNDIASTIQNTQPAIEVFDESIPEDTESEQDNPIAANENIPRTIESRPQIEDSSSIRRGHYPCKKCNKILTNKKLFVVSALLL